MIIPPENPQKQTPNKHPKNPTKKQQQHHYGRIYFLAFNSFKTFLNSANVFSVSFLKEGRKEIFYLTTHSTHFIYGYMAWGIW